MTLNKQRFSGSNFDFNLSKSPIIYAILNLTPDSFFDGGVNAGIDNVFQRIEQEMGYGAAIFELGGKSSKPHFDDISADEEWGRVEPYLKAIQKRFPNIILGLDSNTNEVIERGLKSGIQIINDIDGFNSDAKLQLVQQYHPSVVTMFNGRNFDEQPDTLLKTMTDFFEKAIGNLQSAGLSKSEIIVDPGVGFSNHNTLEFDIIKMKAIKELTKLNTPVMTAISRKSFAKRLFGFELEDRLIPTLLFEAYMISLGGGILRVHDVKETRELIETFNIFKDELM
ncbi:dihydropteroate synthase [Lentilactobacillus kisonensis DSM 19906 = JCM 15041]|uniref:Dihydropteroate synthase n=1 Tax=Lentilactobacillus kisonensis DSM 19906 = JCM 15041 TaxID=1423766 RepID=A0A0R1P0H4_9LACO|nr:dihydropteroate synthase [Lentilactobacillus kisonensis DSM 19906 = JCM 15041]